MIRLTDRQWIVSLWSLFGAVLLMALLAASWLMGSVAILAGIGAAVTTFAWRTGRLRPTPPRRSLFDDLPADEEPSDEARP